VHSVVMTVTVKLQLDVLVQVTVVVPSGKTEPEAGEQVTAEPEHAAGSS
jgi:hypothetical protein